MNLAVFLPNWIGDAVMATPALRALRRHHQGARIVGVLKPYVAGVLEGGDWFDRLVFFNGGPWLQSVAAVAWQLRREKIDLAVLFPNSFRSALTAWLGGCKQRIGYARYGRSPLLTDALPVIRDDRGRPLPRPIIDAYNLLTRRAGCPDPGYRMELFTTEADEARAEEVWRRTGLDRYPEVICLNPGAAFGAAKHWPAEYFVALARSLVARRGCGVLVLCGPAERDLARAIATKAGVSSLADSPLSLGLTRACVRRADLLITTDSGPRHFAAALGRPVVSLFGPTHIAWTETYYAGEICLQKEVPCGPCQKRTCPLGHHRCMQELLPEEVLAAACHLLDSTTARTEKWRSA
jgi:lipopolysaccharide heptosyltransferase II